MPAKSRLLRVMIGCCVAALYAMAADAQMSGNPIKIGVLSDFGGVYKDVGGQGSIEAAKLAAEEFGGKIGDSKIEIVSADGQNKPDVASAIARQWYDQDGVNIIVELPASTVALAVRPN